MNKNFYLDIKIYNIIINFILLFWLFPIKSINSDSVDSFESNNLDKRILLSQTQLPKSRLIGAEPNSIANSLEKKEKEDNEINSLNNNLELNSQKKNTNKKLKKNQQKSILSKKYFKKLLIKYNPEDVAPIRAELNQFNSFLKKFKKDDNIIIKAYAEKRPGDSTSKIRRLSLKRALYLRNILLENNFNTTKIQVKALGHDVSLGGNKDLVIISTN